MIEGRSKPYQQITWRFILFSVGKGYYASAQTLIVTENTVHTFAVEIYLKAQSHCITHGTTILLSVSQVKPCQEFAHQPCLCNFSDKVISD